MIWFLHAAYVLFCALHLIERKRSAEPCYCCTGNVKLLPFSAMCFCHKSCLHHAVLACLNASGQDLAEVRGIMFVNVTGASGKYILCFTLLPCPKQNPGLTHGVAVVGFFTDEGMWLYMLSVAPTQCHASLTALNEKAVLNL